MGKHPIRHDVEQPHDQSIKLIPLTLGVNAIVDAWNYGYLNQWPWFGYLSPKTGTVYAVRNVALSSIPAKQTVCRMHRVILGLDPQNPAFCDHINGNTLDNRVCNLRVVTELESSWNRRIVKKTRSGRCGITRSKNGWLARFSLNGRRIVLGYRESLEDAIKLREEAEIKYWGEYRRPA